jgi:tetratricopeptide (TPR) repeat protein
MAVVYRARQKKLNRPVALKVLLAAEGAPKHLVEQLQQEAQSAAKLRHPNIVTVLDVDVFKGIHYIAMDLVDGKSLDRLVGKRRFKGKAAAEIMKKIAEALHYAHEQGVIHRDIKPSNILLVKGDDPRVMDFGLAKDRTTGTDPLAGAGISGTPEYMSPEQAQGSDSIDRRSDVFSLGAVLYALLTGTAPFKGNTAEETLKLAIQAEPAAPSTVNPQTPVELEAICLKAMSKERENRYPSAQAMAEDLDHFLKEEPVTAASQTYMSVMLKKARRNLPLVGGVGGGVLLILIVVLAMLFGGNGSDEEAAQREKEEAEAARREAEAEKRDEESRQAWKKMYKLAKQGIIDKIRRIKADVRSRINQAYNEMGRDPDMALTTLMDARALLLEMGDRVMVDAPEEYRHMLVKDKEILEEASAKHDGLALDQAKASALGARGWNRWERELDLDGAMLDYGEAIRTSPEVPTVLAGRGMMYREAAMWEAAYQDLSKAAKKLKDFLATPENLKYLLDAAIRAGHLEEARTWIDSLPENGADRAYYEGELLLQKGDAKGALEQFKKAIKKQTFHGPAHIGRCIALDRTGQREDALKSLDFVTTQIRTMMISRQKKKTAREEMIVQRDLLDALIEKGRIHTAMAKKAAGEEKITHESEARSCFQEALRIHPADNRARAGLFELGG